MNKCEICGQEKDEDLDVIVDCEQMFWACLDCVRSYTGDALDE